jgi:hypothetical protein
MGADATLAAAIRIPRDAAGWVSLWRSAEIPVLDETAQQLEELRAREDDVDARLLARVVSADPLMCLKLLAHVSTHRSSKRITDTETATAALVMMASPRRWRGCSVYWHARAALPVLLLALRCTAWTTTPK